MEFFEAVKNRRSIRRFKTASVEPEKIQKILEAANAAPSAGDLQAYEIVIVKSAEQKRKLCDAAYGQTSITSAPVVLVLLANADRSTIKYGERGKLYAIQDATIAGAYIQLAAVALGLGSVWVGAFDEAAVSAVVNVKGARPIAIIPIGYGAEASYKTPRRGVKDISRKL